jgi:hypothetical protein
MNVMTFEIQEPVCSTKFFRAPIQTRFIRITGDGLLFENFGIMEGQQSCPSTLARYGIRRL